MEKTYSYVVNPEAVAVLVPVLRSAPNFTPCNFRALFGWQMLGSAVKESGKHSCILRAPGGLVLANFEKAGPDTYWHFILSSASDAAPIDRMNRDCDPFAP